MIDFENTPVPESPVVVYHGTRAPPEVLRRDGLRYPTEQEFMEMIRGAMERAGLSFEEWQRGQEWLIKKGRLTQSREMRQGYRQKIWTTADIETAWRYAGRAPEIVSEAVRNEVYRLYWRRKAAIEMADAAVEKALYGIGNPAVVVLDAKKIGAVGGHNEPISRIIGPEAIVDILVSA
jgi:hypothetical protein